ncbi:hydantoinase/oxoprolinase [Epithele typhae]|uniref:hydantoinase/oxoprolinase n=1 Tax=Epithele typhae TaxID=378194 RepID=UPI0020073389|nr:hydantoinase/oxoprolinase [Epithele typhae]KAH9941324.1 hydantoinase/oxoprolinase [Epithele typhae]
MLRIGVDVGGTNTDGVLIDVTRLHEPSRGVLAHYKAPTTTDVSKGIEEAVREVLRLASVSPTEVASVSIGTTAFINAVLEADARRLAKVAVIRLSSVFTKQCPPFIDFPRPLRILTEGHVGYVDGGFEIDGREIRPINEAQIVEQCAIVKEKGLKNVSTFNIVVLTGIFSSLDNDGKQEIAAKAIIERELGPSVNVVASREVGQVGLLERENASILNASILTFAQRTIRGFQNAMRTLELTCPLFLTQNDGTLTTAASAARLPIRTFASGPTNSMRGAAFLAGLDDRTRGSSEVEKGKSTIVVDVGGTTSDVGVLLPSGFPRQAASYIEVGGVRTNFAMADVQSIALGGGSVVHAAEDGKVSVGPESVGYNLTRDARVFGGNVLTTTDIIVASGRAELGDKALVSDVSADTVAQGVQRIKKLLENIIDKMKTSPEDITVLLVGGGSIISPDELAGVKEIIRPPFFGVANAVGAAMAKVAGEIDTIEILAGRDIHTVVEAIKKQAIAKAIAAGADPATVKIVEVTNLPVQYVTNQATRIIVKAAGDLAAQAVASVDGAEFVLVDVSESNEGEKSLTNEAEATEGSGIGEAPIDIDTYKPTILPDRAWKLTELDIEWIAEGCAVVGTGGGGSSYPPFLMSRAALRAGKEILVADPNDVPEEQLFVRVGFMGSPSVGMERLQGGDELPSASRALMQYIGATEFAGFIAEEIGGGNGVQPMIVAAKTGKTVLDCDLMGRAYPNMYQTIPGAYDLPNSLTPCAISDGMGSTIVLPSARNLKAVEDILRAVATEMGSKAGVAGYPMSRKNCSDYGVPHSVSQAWRLGRAIALCRKHNDLKGIPRALLGLQNGACLFVGKIVDVRREVRKGFTWGEVTIAPLLEEEEEDGGSPGGALGGTTLPVKPDDRLVIPFQNENLYAYILSATGEKTIHTTVPDLITVLDSQNGAALGTPEYRYGLRVTVMAFAGHPLWTTTEGLACGGPEAFGLDIEFKTIGAYRDPVSVVKEFASA